jgi:hypothetical protein
MGRYTVTWSPRAERRLAELWLAAPDRDAVTRASSFVDRELGRSPHGQGESRAGAERLWIVEPLAFLYSISDDDRLVHVLDLDLAYAKSSVGSGLPGLPAPSFPSISPSTRPVVSAVPIALPTFAGNSRGIAEFA